MKPHISFANVPGNIPYFMDAVGEILSTRKYLKGVYNKEFAKRWAKVNNANYCILTSSGTAALFATLKSLLPEEKSKVIVPNLSYSATVDAVLEAGHVPIYCKVLPNGCIDQEEAEKLLQQDPEIVAIIIVHLYGQQVEINQNLLDSALVIEDACQAHGALERVQGQAACFSFYPSKNLGTIGDGGGIVTNIPGLYSRLEMYINCGDAFSEKYVHSIPGLNLRMGEIKAAYLFSRVNYLENENTKRIEVAKLYWETGIKPVSGFTNNVYHLFPILVENPSQFRELLREEGIETGQHYPYTLSGLRAEEIDDEHGQRIASHNVTLPMGPHLSTEDVDYVCKVIREKYFLNGLIWCRNAQSSF